MENVTSNGTHSLLHLDEGLLIFEKERNLKNNYISLRKLPNHNITCKINKNVCSISDSVAVANAFDRYLQILRSPNGNGVGAGVFIGELDTILNEDTGIADSITLKEQTAGLDSIEGLLQNWKTTLENSNTSPSFGKQPQVTVDDFLIKQVKSPSEKAQDVSNGDEGCIGEQHSPHRNCESPSKIIEGEELSTNFKSTRRVVVERPYVCSNCKMAFKRNLHLKRHFIVTHTVHKNFKCDICNKSFSRKDYLDKHVSGHQKKNFKLKLLRQGIVVRTKIFSKSDK